MDREKRRGRPRRGDAFRQDYIEERSPDDYPVIGENDKQQCLIRRRIEEVKEGIRIEQEALNDVWD